MEVMNFMNVRDNERNSAENWNKSEVGIEDEKCTSKKLKKQSKNCKVKGDRYLCKKCEKGFKSPQAVFGHMRCHSNSNTNSNMVHHIPRKKRSVGRYKINPASSYTSWSYLNSSSSSSLTLVNHDDNDQLEDIAVSLLMLANGGPLSHSFSDDDSVNLSSASLQSDFHMGAHFEPGVKQCGLFHPIQSDFDMDAGFEPGVKQCGLFHPAQPAAENVSGSDIVVCFDSIKDRNEDSLTDVLIPSELCNAKMRDQQVQVEISHTTESLNPTSYAPAPENPKSDDVDIQSGHTTKHQSELFDSEIRTVDTMVDSLSSKSCHLPVEQTKVVDHASHICDDGPAIWDNVCYKEYMCRFCNRRFLSHQALGGHRLHCPSKKKFCRARATATNISNIVVPQDGSNKKSWIHKCLKCCKAFSSGQALGGHMRVHFNSNV